MRNSISEDKRKGYILFIVGTTIFLIVYFIYEKNLTEKLEECSFYTIIYPIRMPDTHKLYFYFFYKNRKYNGSTSVGAEDLGWDYTIPKTLKARYWLRVNCNNFETYRVNWEITVPDTIKRIPEAGWNEIPYDLDKIKKE